MSESTVTAVRAKSPVTGRWLVIVFVVVTILAFIDFDLNALSDIASARVVLALTFGLLSLSSVIYRRVSERAG